MNPIIVMGYSPKPGVPLDDYTDFPVGRRFTMEDVDAMTDQGVLPPGLILQAIGTPPVIVRGHYNEVQTVEVMRVQ